MLSYRQPDAARLVVQLTVELPHTAAAVDTLTDLLGAIADLPGAVLSTTAEAPRPLEAVPPPRLSTPDRLHIDARSRRVVRQGVAVELTRLEFDLLLFLATRPNVVHRRGILLDQVWGVAEPYVSRTVDVHIRRLRDKLGSFGGLINTVRGVGYRFDGAHLVVVDQADAS